MARRFRILAVALTTAAQLAVYSTPALAEGERLEANRVPVATDVGFRLLGIPLTVVGFVSFCVVSPLIAITRPTEFGSAWNYWVAHPAKFTWGDPLGQHPDRRNAKFGDLTVKNGI